MGTLGGSYVDRIIVNGDYNPRRNDYDIAMMRLSSPISVGGKVIDLPLFFHQLIVQNFPLGEESVGRTRWAH